MSSIKVSIIIPVYNAERYINECLSSVQKQSLKEIEIICIDDGSTDNSKEIIKSFQKSDSRIKYFHQNNQGSGVARNYGIDVATGEYIVFLDSDDLYYDASGLEKIYSIAHNKGATLAASFIKKLLNDSEYTVHPAFKEYAGKSFTDMWINFDDIQEDNYYQAYIFKRQFLIENKIRFPFYRRYQDPPFLLSVMEIEKNICFVPVYLYVYRWGHQSIERITNNVEHLVMGLRDSFEFSIRHRYNKLKEKIIRRLNKDYYNVIAEKRQICKVKKVLEEIKRLSVDDGCVSKIRIFQEENDCVSVSVLVPVYNVEKYLPQCLDSIISQSLSDIEIICINDGSTDNSLSILRAYEKKDKRIRVIDKPNTGYGHTMNVGLKEARGEYIGIVESDDWIEPNMYEQLYTIAKQHPDVDVVKSDILIYEQDGRTSYLRSWRGIVPYKYVFKLDEKKDLIPARPSTTTGIYRRNTIKEKNIKYNETPGASFQDVGFSLLVKMFSHRAIVIDEGFYHYRIDNPTSSRNTSNKGFCIFNEFQYVEQIIKNEIGLKEKYEPYLLIAKYRIYKWCSQRVLDTEKFKKRMAEEFDLSKKNGYLIKKMWLEDEWDEVNKMIFSAIYCDSNKMGAVSTSPIFFTANHARGNTEFLSHYIPKCLYAEYESECYSLLKQFKSILGRLDVIAFEKDKDKWGTIFGGIPVCSPHSIDSSYVVIYNEHKPTAINQGITCISLDTLLNRMTKMQKIH